MKIFLDKQEKKWVDSIAFILILFEWLEYFLHCAIEKNYCLLPGYLALNVSIALLLVLVKKIFRTPHKTIIWRWLTNLIAQH